uniref:SCP domain-containing protein n=1 Tax=Haemonchus contortus TaxID=6289 RepID=A0A7I4Y0B2_HAECO|nr:unnamed protein product [Haemonchus contortus]
MYSLIALLICYTLLLTEGHTKSEEEFQYRQNVPKIAKKALLDAINEERETLGLESKIEYDRELSKKAHKGESGGPLSLLEGQSAFENTWKETLKNALTSNGKGKTNFAEKIGCEITLKTSPEDGSHIVILYCLLGDKDGNVL